MDGSLTLSWFLSFLGTLIDLIISVLGGPSTQYMLSRESQKVEVPWAASRSTEVIQGHTRPQPETGKPTQLAQCPAKACDFSV